ncbi:hypothetical protein AAG906_038565 [Vitis piasezkii]
MEHLPVEVIGNILSRLGAARDIVIASATCRKWREAFCYHLHTLSFNSKDWPLYHDLTTSQLEILITETLLQTTGLQGLSISMDEVGEFSASVVTFWLMYTRETLRSLWYNVRTTPNVNILEICGRQKLETLFLAHNFITGVEPNFQRFSCLKSLSLSSVSISALDMSLLLTACPKIEILDLVNLEIAMSDTQDKVKLRSPTLKIHIEADSLEHLHLKDCDLKLIKLAGKGTLKQLVIDDVSSVHLDIGDQSLENLEVVDINNFTIIWPKFYQMISRSSKLRRLQLWSVFFDDNNEIVDLETFAVCFPQRSHLSLWYVFLRDGVHYALPGSSHLENVIEMDVGWTTINELFPDWLVIHGQGMSSKEKKECMRLTSLIKYFMDDKYEHVEVQLAYT